jgi:hypothetical protein
VAVITIRLGTSLRLPKQDTRRHVVLKSAMPHHVVVSHVDSTYPKRGCVQVVKHGKTETQTRCGSGPMAYRSNVLGTGKDPGWNRNWSRTVAGWDSLP